MKKLITLILIVFSITTFAQNSFQRIIAQNEIFFTKTDSVWNQVDTTGNFLRVLDISDGNDVIKLGMSDNDSISNYIYYIEKTSIIEGGLVYFCRDANDYPLIVELVDNAVALYYYYNQEKNIFEKAERLIIVEKQKKFID